MNNRRNDKTDPFSSVKAALEEKPDGFIIQSDDVVGYWDPEECPIRCIPRTAKVFDGNIERTKPSVLILAELTMPCVLNLKKEVGESEAEKIIGKKGDMVGIWGKPGMRAIRNLCGVEVKITATGEKDTGKPNPMKLFSVESATRGTQLLISDDSRDKSRAVKTFLEGRAVSAGETTVGTSDDGDTDNVPF